MVRVLAGGHVSDTGRASKSQRAAAKLPSQVRRWSPRTCARLRGLQEIGPTCCDAIVGSLNGISHVNYSRDAQAHKRLEVRASVRIAIYGRIGDGWASLMSVEPLILDEVREMLPSVGCGVGLDRSAFREDHVVRSELNLKILDILHTSRHSRYDRGTVDKRGRLDKHAIDKQSM